MAVFRSREQCTEHRQWCPCHDLSTDWVKKHRVAWERNADCPEEWHHHPYSLGQEDLYNSASMNRVVSYWLLPLFTQTTEHEDQGMICNTACLAMASKVLKTLSTAKLLIEMQVLSDWHFIKRETTHTISKRHCL